MRRLKVVMIEDDSDLCSGWADIFKLIGHDFECFNNAHHVLSKPDIFDDCDILISDFYLPDINGIELIKRVRKIRDDVPAILLTGSRDAGIKNASEEINNCSILYKPINIEDIEHKLEQLFG